VLEAFARAGKIPAETFLPGPAAVLHNVARNSFSRWGFLKPPIPPPLDGIIAERGAGEISAPWHLRC
jgi:hypothetical protein